MTRIVADTNLLISSVFWEGAPYRIVISAIEGKTEVIVSAQILNEVRKVLKDPKEKFQLSEQETDDIIDSILLYAKVVEPTVEVCLSRDPKDNPVIACAITANAKFIVTRDKDLLDLVSCEGIKIISPEEFCGATG